MVMVISRKSTETRKGCHSVSVLFSMVVIISFVPISRVFQRNEIVDIYSRHQHDVTRPRGASPKP